MTKDTFTIPEAAELLHCHPQTLRAAIRAGRLKAARIGKALSISKTELASYFAARGGGQLFNPDAQG